MANSQRLGESQSIKKEREENGEKNREKTEKKQRKKTKTKYLPVVFGETQTK